MERSVPLASAQYTTSRCASHEEVVSRLMNVGYEVGRRAIEIVSYRHSKGCIHMRPVNVLEAIKQVSSLLWPYLFGKHPSQVQRDDENQALFYLFDDTPKFTKFMSEPVKAQPHSTPLDTPGYFLAGIVKGYLESAGFECEVDAAWKFSDRTSQKQAVTIVKFATSAMSREQSTFR